MILDFEDANPPVWFRYPDDPDKMAVAVRLCAGEALDEIRKATRKKRVEYKKGQRFVFFDVNEDLENEMVWDYCIVDWENMKDPKKKNMPCTKENKCKAMRKSPKFAAFLAVCLRQLAIDLPELQESAEGN